jgi:hypothetical protein
MNTNQKVTTPIGEGISQGAFAIRDANGELITHGTLVRMPVNDQTRVHLTQSNCLTPRAQRSALFVFPMSENGYISREFAKAMNLVVFVMVFLFCLLRDWPW